MVTLRETSRDSSGSRESSPAVSCHILQRGAGYLPVGMVKEVSVDTSRETLAAMTMSGEPPLRRLSRLRFR